MCQGLLDRGSEIQAAEPVSAGIELATAGWQHGGGSDLPERTGRCYESRLREARNKRAARVRTVGSVAAVSSSSHSSNAAIH